MTSLEELKQLIDYIHRRLPDEEKIDAAEHNRILKTLVDTLAGIGANVFLGIATPETIPEQSPAIKCFYLATKKGNYPRFGDLVINSPLAVIYWNGFDWEKHEIEVSVNVNVDINDYIDLSNYAKLTADNEFVGNQKIIGSLETGETRGKLRPVANRNREMTDGEAVVWDTLLQIIKTVKQVPDSILWDGNAFDDHLDQAVRTIDNVKFKSVISTDFESKLKGWLIDVLGNAEFRDVLLRSFKSWNFTAGPLGAGVGMVNDDELQTDNLLVRKIMFVLEMMVQRMKFQGGIMVLSPATGFKINRVEIFDTYYRVYCRPEDVNEFEVNDQARIQNFTGDNIKYLWSLTLSKGDDYIDISRIDKDGDGVPAEGDEIVQIGNRTNPDRQDAVLLSAVNGEVGIFTYYGINSFDLSSKEGSWLGKHGEKKGAVIRGEVHITTGSSGLEQFDEYEDVDKRIQDAQNSADSVQDVVNNLISIIIPDLQGQIDGSIMSHEGTIPPTLTNEPAVNWTTEEEKNRHIGDYYDYFLTFDGEKVTERYKFSKLNGVYQWVRVADSGSALAASVAREALGLAGTKATITWGDTLPAVPYNINDVWIKTNGSMYICNHQRLEGETGSQSDWQLFNDTQLRLAQMAADNVISIEEKPSLRDTWDQIKEEFKAYQAQATKYGVSITALQNAYNTLDTFLTSTVKISQDEDTKLSVAQKTEYNQDFANYYSERTTFANVIAQKIADGAVGNIQFGMVNLLKGSNVELGTQKYNIGIYYFDKKPEVGKTYTLVICYTIGENNTHIGAYQDGGSYLISNFATKGNKIIESKTFKYSAPSSPNNMSFYQFPNGTYGSKVHWAVLVEGNKGPSGWVPALSEQGEEAAKEAVDSMKITSRNLWILKNVCSYASSNVHPDRKPFTIDNYKIIVDKNPADLIGCNIKAPGSKVVVSGKTNLEKITPYYTCRDSNGSVIKSQTSMNIAVSDGRFEFSINNIPANTSVMALGLGYYPFASAYWLDEVSVVSGDKSVGFTPSPEDVQKEIDDVSNAVTNLNTTINGAFKDGIISEAEAKAIASNISILNAEKADIDNAYTPLYNSPYLLSGTTAATNLSSAKTAYNTAHSALITEINKAIADGKTTPEEKANVDTKFTAYNLALGTYKKRVEEANKAIQDQVKALAEQDATNKVDNIQVGGTNLFPVSKLNNVGCRGNSSKEGNGTEIIFKCNNPSTWAILPVSIPTALVPVNTDFVISMDIRNTNGFGYEVTATSGTPTLISIVKFENTTNEWKRVYKVFNSGNKANIGGINLWGVGDVRHIKIEIGNKATDWSPAPEDVDQAIQDAIAKTIDITAPSQVFKYGAGYTGTPTPSSIVLTANPRNFTPTSYQWQYLNGSTWTNISGATSSTYSVAPGNTTLFPSGTNVRTFRCICDGDEKLSDSFTLAKLADGATGSKGDKGDTGADGKGIKSSVITYQASTSGTTVPTGTWSSSIPAVAANQYLWTRTIITYTDDTTSTSYSIGKIGATGSKGDKGDTGAAGNGVKSTTVTYQASTSGTTVPTGTWGTTIPSVAANQYLWTRTVITYTDNTTSTSYSIGKIGATGATGAAGKDAYTVLLTNEAHAFAGSTAAALAGSTTCGVIAYKGTGQVAVTIGTITGLPAGMTTSITGNGTTTPVITFTVTTSMKTASGTVSIPVTVDGKSFTRVFSYSIAFKGATGATGSKGDKGDTGAAGKGIKSSVITYQASTSGTTVPTGTWSSTIPAVAAGSYLWTKTVITYTDNTTSTMYSVGRMGTNGTNGNAGNGVSSTTITYQASTSGTTAPTGTWSSSIPSVAAGSHLWTRTIISYTNGTTSTIYSVGKMGNTGATGQPGESINGKMLYKDPEFKVGLNGTKTYGAQNGGGSVVISRTKKSTGQNQAGSLTSTEAAKIKEKLAGSPYSESDWCLYIKAYGGTSTSHLGGFYFGNQSRANAVFIVKVSAKIPVGYTLKNAHNSHGTGYKQELLTSMAGTGKYETYIFKETCGSSGTFSTVNHLYLSGPVTTEAAPCEWFVDYATVIDQTADGYSDIEIVTKDSFATQMGYTSFQDMIDQTVAKGGKLIVDGLLNAKLIDVNTLAANNAFIDKLRTNILKANVITANMISVIGFTFADNKIIGGKDFGVGPGVKVTSTDSEKSFKAYKDASNYISMYYNSASDWGLKGVVGGAELLKLGITNKLGPFAIEGSWLRGSNLALSGSQLNFSYSGHQVYVGSHPDMTTAGNAKLGTFMLSGGGYGGLGSNKQVALIAGAPNNANSYAMAVTQGMLKMFPNAHIVSGVSRAYMTGTNPGITLGNEHPNMICLYGTGNRKKVNLYAGMEIGSHFFITSEASQGFDVLCTGSERFYRNGNTYVAVQSSGQDTVLVMKTDTYKWTACQLPINWLGTWNP